MKRLPALPTPPRPPLALPGPAGAALGPMPLGRGTYRVLGAFQPHKRVAVKFTRHGSRYYATATIATPYGPVDVCASYDARPLLPLIHERVHAMLEDSGLIHECLEEQKKGKVPMIVRLKNGTARLVQIDKRAATARKIAKAHRESTATGGFFDDVLSVVTAPAKAAVSVATDAVEAVADPVGTVKGAIGKAGRLAKGDIAGIVPGPLQGTFKEIVGKATQIVGKAGAATQLSEVLKKASTSPELAQALGMVVVLGPVALGPAGIPISATAALAQKAMAGSAPAIEYVSKLGERAKAGDPEASKALKTVLVAAEKIKRKGRPKLKPGLPAHLAPAVTVATAPTLYNYNPPVVPTASLQINPATGLPAGFPMPPSGMAIGAIPAAFPVSALAQIAQTHQDRTHRSGVAGDTLAHGTEALSRSVRSPRARRGLVTFST